VKKKEEEEGGRRKGCERGRGRKGQKS